MYTKAPEANDSLYKLNDAVGKKWILQTVLSVQAKSFLLHIFSFLPLSFIHSTKTDKKPMQTPKIDILHGQAFTTINSFTTVCLTCSWQTAHDKCAVS